MDANRISLGSGHLEPLFSNNVGPNRGRVTLLRDAITLERDSAKREGSQEQQTKQHASQEDLEKQEQSSEQQAEQPHRRLDIVV